ncbi:MAG: N-acetylneuraminate synthase [Muribaculaceae bacterium]|nr:N-acetylneuraminate synthase [Muribaculaceae bacterium]MEE1297594.1 N-acetylneuraminate synthase [Muribaculaceae bacterium]
MRHTIIIAEAGVNHNGNMDIAKRLIDAAADAGVDYVKFQTFKTENLVSFNAPTAEYQKAATQETSQYAMLKRLELNEQQHIELIEYCNKKGVKFLSTAFDMDSIDLLESLNLDLWKIPSGEITNYPYLARIAATGKPIIMSTGMCDTSDINNALDALIENGATKESITLLHCNTQYPTPYEDVNLLAMNTIKSDYGLATGYSDHTQGIEIPVAAVALGACVIEKHFTLDRNMEGPDHKASLEPAELKKMVEAIRIVEQALGSTSKTVSPSEAQNKSIARKSIVAKRNIHKGETLTEDNITVKRPGNGISPMKWREVIGTPATRDFAPDEPIEM